MEIEVLSSSGACTRSVGSFPDVCPQCGEPTISQFANGYIDQALLYLGFHCSRNDCRSYFLTLYQPDFRGTFFFARNITGTPGASKFKDEIGRVSPDFLSIFRESESAFDLGLTQICGMGYRKALEFLVKDYIIFKSPSKEDQIKAMPLQACMDSFIENPRIKDIAKRAAWLGNDESHYVRKWEELDVSHLKKLIELTVYWIETEYLTDEMVRSMNQPK